MASTIAYGLTESGGNLRVNEDALYLSGRIKPELIGGREGESGTFTDRAQLYLVSDGFGGPGSGDLAGRLVFQVAVQHLDKIPRDPDTAFDFVKWVKELLAESDRRISQELQSRSFGQAGCSVALLFIIDSQAYTMTLGSAALYLCRDQELFLQAGPQETPDGKPLIHLGKRHENTVPVIQNIKKLDLEQGDQFLLMTDGAYKNVTTSDIRSALIDQQAFTSTIDQLFDLASTNDENANKTMVAVRVTRMNSHTEDESGQADHSVYRRPKDEDVARLSKEHRADIHVRQPRQARPQAVDRGDDHMREKRDGVRPSRYDDPDEEAKEGSLVSTFLKSLLLGFLIGLAIMLTLWFIFLS